MLAGEQLLAKSAKLLVTVDDHFMHHVATDTHKPAKWLLSQIMEVLAEHVEIVLLSLPALLEGLCPFWHVCADRARTAQIAHACIIIVRILVVLGLLPETLLRSTDYPTTL